jgi:hypothetical protein
LGATIGSVGEGRLIALLSIVPTRKPTVTDSGEHDQLPPKTAVDWRAELDAVQDAIRRFIAARRDGPLSEADTRRYEELGRLEAGLLERHER